MLSHIHPYSMFSAIDLEGVIPPKTDCETGCCHISQ